MNTETAITAHQLAMQRLGLDPERAGSLSGADFDKAGVPMLGGCELCAASLAAYNAFPSKSGLWRCRDCIGDTGWTNVYEAVRDIFGDKALRGYSNA